MLSNMHEDFQQVEWDERLEDELRAILASAISEDLGRQGDLTTQALIPEDAPGRGELVARESGIVAGLRGVRTILAAFDPRLPWSQLTGDGKPIEPGERLGILEGPAHALLAAERTLLNILGRLSGIATLTQRYVAAVQGTNARIYDTRKTTPGWRRLEKYAVRCGGGRNHRCGLNEAVLIKDNHLALGSRLCCGRGFTPDEAVRHARRYLQTVASERPILVEIEVDDLQQLDAVLTAGPDLILLDNMTPQQLCQAVARRNELNPGVELEASGGVDLSTVRAIALSGVERISIGAITKSAPALDLGLDWLP